jgi:N-acetylglutamate synthase-like GNAT family acetyltransferase
MQLHLRKATSEDKAKVLDVESKSTPNLRYLPYVYDDWSTEERGDLSVVELEGEIIGVGKYTRLPDDSVWLEALRVTPAKQGIGAGKRLYGHWFQLALEQDIKTMRMYTNVSNVKSKGLAERYGLCVQGTYREALKPLKDITSISETAAFRQVNNLKEATKLLMDQSERWGEFLVINRTFYKLNPATCKYFTEQGMVYKEAETGSVITLGARFMPWQSLHIGLISGDYESCLRFALQKGLEMKVERLSILYPPEAMEVQDGLTRFGFKQSPDNFITMGINL